MPATSSRDVAVVRRHTVAKSIRTGSIGAFIVSLGVVFEGTTVVLNAVRNALVGRLGLRCSSFIAREHTVLTLTCLHTLVDLTAGFITLHGQSVAKAGAQLVFTAFLNTVVIPSTTALLGTLAQLRILGTGEWTGVT